MVVEIVVKCHNCGTEYDRTFWDFCPHCSGNINLDVPTEQIQNTQSKPVGTNHFM